MGKDLRTKSKAFDGTMRAPNRAMLRAVGVTDEDFKKPMVGVASTWAEVTPCNIHLNDLALIAKKRCASSRCGTIDFQYDYGIRRDFHGNTGDALFFAKQRSYL